LALIDRTPGAAGRATTIDDSGVKHVYESRRWKDFVLRDGQAAD
jgi:hypothetical protein